MSNMKIKKSTNTLKILLKSLVSILLLYFIFRFIGIGNVYNELLNVNLYYIAVPVFFVIFQILFKAIKWNLIINMFNKSISLTASLVYTLISLSFGLITPARVGEFIKAKYLVDETKIKYRYAISTVIIDKLFDLVAIVLLALVGFSLLGKYIPYTDYAIIGLFIFLIVLILTFIFLKSVPNLLSYILPKKLSSVFEKINLDRTLYTKTFLYSLSVWVIYLIGGFFILKSLGFDTVPINGLMAVIPLMALSSAIPISFGGVGIRDLVAVSFFSILGIEAEKSVIFSLLYTFIFFGIPAIFGAILYLKRKQNANFVKFFDNFKIKQT